MPEIEFVPEETTLATPVMPDAKPEEGKEAAASEDFVIEEEGLEAALPADSKIAEGEDKETATLKQKLADKDQELMKLAWRLEQIEQGLKEKPAAAAAPAKSDEPEYTDAQLKTYLEEHDNAPDAQIQVANYIAKREASKQRKEAEAMYATGQTAREFRDLETQVLGNRTDIKDPMIAGKVANLRKSFNLDGHPGGGLLAYALYKFWESEETKQKEAATSARERKAKAASLDKTKTPSKDKGNGLTPEHLAMAEKLGIKDTKLYAKFVNQAEKE